MKSKKTISSTCVKGWLEVDQDDAMLITPDRIVLSTATGFPATRIFGALTVYVSRNRPIRLTLEGKRAKTVEYAVVPPYTRHSALTFDGHITKVLIETERVDVPRLMDYLTGDAKRSNAVADRMREGFASLPQAISQEFAIDETFFGGKLPSRKLDDRIAKVIEDINGNPGVQFSATDCAALAGLSFSRFVHLFRTETNATFRGYQSWRHARNFMPFVNGQYSLVDVALQIGYADAPHFSRSIRKFYGITPKQIASVSRKLRVVVQPQRTNPG